MQQRKQSSVRGMFVILMIILNTIILEKSITSHHLHSSALLTLPLLVFAIILLERKPI